MCPSSLECSSRVQLYADRGRNDETRAKNSCLPGSPSHCSVNTHRSAAPACSCAYVCIHGLLGVCWTRCLPPISHKALFILAHMEDGGAVQLKPSGAFSDVADAVGFIWCEKLQSSISLTWSPLPLSAQTNGNCCLHVQMWSTASAGHQYL